MKEQVDELGKATNIDFPALKYGFAFTGNLSILARLPEDKVIADHTYLHHVGDSFTLYQESSQGIKILVTVLDGLTTALANFPIRQNEAGTLYVAHPNIPTDLTPEAVQELFL
ncbi:hypothetical protein FC83_GL001621 [Agrilactobacillus composti DSM 18527 = JCM 14202]|uniref:Uncharacterized protein n=1 Tax=Agrilactobacillus composti DSM 18527 = JCM 14202 TaxID=1423734 RepID=X0QK78_9LACO|nr:hypothetical protein [Agrilactobacillus composti]KRM30490.1 hypothetical protein FC83_GL001621 [Agrilactobacillus composti DSM 18527 = JCM 14202]GAF38985.1 hypothetical protein JCM14202_817 [Agrilactobacillus composti DSM 18527 = JCM 14202]